MKIDIPWSDIHDNLRVLGAAKPLFEELAQKEDTPGIFRAWLKENAERCDELIKTISEATNDASVPRTRAQRSDAGVPRTRHPENGARKSRVRADSGS